MKNKSITTLKQLYQNAMGGVWFGISLKGGVYSKKEIVYYPQSKKFHITNHIDGSQQRLTEKQLMDKNYTNIGEAMRKKALFIID